MSNLNLIVKVGMYSISDPIPKYDFSKLADTDYSKTMGLVAATQNQLNEQIKSKMRLDPNAKQIRYFYYEATDESR